MARKATNKARARGDELRGERLSYGAPVSVGGRTVITVTRVRASRGGGGRSVDSAPIGYIEVTAEGSAFHPFVDHARSLRALRTLAAGATTVVGLMAGARALRSPRSSTRLLPPGRPFR
jgi:hypothetical protein